ncbi:MAG: hypothetical protein ABH846_00310 [Patescibacteria group bacterium]
MWETIPKKQIVRETSFFLDWLAKRVLIESNLRKSKETLLEAQRLAPEHKSLETTPQGAPWHAEGAVVARHVERILAGLFAIVDGESLLDIEEFSRHKNLHHEIEELEQIIREHAATLQAFALLHDLGKAVTVSFEAPTDSKGAAEGFFQNKYRRSEQATETERHTYLKLVKAMQVKNPDLNEEEVMAKFYDEYEIIAHFYRHAPISAGQQFAEAREKICDKLRLSARERRLLEFTIRHHIEVIHAFAKRPEPSKFRTYTAKANKAGFDADDALDFMLAALFLDTAVGSLRYEEGIFDVDLRPTVNFLLSEEMLLPQRREQRRSKIELQKTRAFKQMLNDSGLEPEEVFKVLGTPFTAERGKIMQEIYQLIVDPDQPIDFGAQTDYLLPKINKARSAFDESQHIVPR